MPIALRARMQSQLPFRGARAEADHDRRLRALPAAYARPIPPDVDVESAVGEARTLAARIEANDSAGDAHRPQRRARVDALDAGADALERADARMTHAVLDFARACVALEPRMRTIAARYAAVLARAARGSVDDRQLWDAHAWLGSLDPALAAKVVVVVRREQQVADAEDLRRRAYHALAVRLRGATDARRC